MIPLRSFGKTDVKISALGLGGHHLGAAKDEATAVAIVHRAIDGGITFFDNCWEYNRGKSEDWLGKGLRGLRDRAFVMTQGLHSWPGCFAGHANAGAVSAAVADRPSGLWQIHGVTFQNDPSYLFDQAAQPKRCTKQSNKAKCAL